MTKYYRAHFLVFHMLKAYPDDLVQFLLTGFWIVVGNQVGHQSGVLFLARRLNSLGVGCGWISVKHYRINKKHTVKCPRQETLVLGDELPLLLG